MAHLPAFDLPDRTRAPAPGNNSAAAGNKKKKKKTKKVVKDWEAYMGDESVKENWDRFLHDLGLGDFKFKSKKQCKKELKACRKWVNICDFLSLVKKRNAEAESIDDEEMRAAHLNAPVEVKLHASESALSAYSRKTGKIYPRKAISNDSPLKLLLARIL